jgi:hypothetical protein
MCLNAQNQGSSPLSLSRIASPDWQNDRPAFAGDPLMDWESEPEQPPASPFELASSDARQKASGTTLA